MMIKKKNKKSPSVHPDLKAPTAIYRLPAFPQFFLCHLQPFRAEDAGATLWTLLHADGRGPVEDEAVLRPARGRSWTWGGGCLGGWYSVTKRC